MLSVEIDGLRIAYRRAGDGPPLLLLHGGLSDSRDWRPQIEALSDEFTVVAWDAPGAGQSSDPPEPFGLADWGDSLGSFLEALELDGVHALGLSWGGVVAQELYRRHPGRVRSLILADTYAGWKGSLPAEVVAARLEAGLRESTMPPSELVSSWLPTLFVDTTPPEIREEIASHMLDFHPAGARLMLHAVASADSRDLLPQIRVPTLLIWGEADQRSPLSVAHEFRNAIPDARLAVIPDAGHMSNVEQPARFNAQVREFCRALSARR